MQWRSKRTLVGIAAAAALATGGGVAYSATQGGGSGPGDNLADVAERLGVTEAELRAAFQAEALEHLEEAVAAGELTEEQAAEIRERIESGEPPFRARGGDRHFDGDGPFGEGGPPPGIGLFGAIDTAAEYLGLERRDLFEQLAGGKTLAEVAEAEGKSVEGLEEALLDEARASIHALVTEGIELEFRGGDGMPDGPPFGPDDEEPSTGASA